MPLQGIFECLIISAVVEAAHVSRGIMQDLA